MREALARRIGAFVDTWGTSEPFEELALAVHHHQRHLHVLGRADRFDDIPAVATPMFQWLDVSAPGCDAVRFATSGTTGTRSGIHRMRDTSLYDRGALAMFRRAVPDAPAEVLALLEDAPDSSLAHMVGAFGNATWHVRNGALDVPGLARRVTSAPLFVAATAFSLVAWLDAEPPPLRPGSILMVTGGFKGRVREVSPSELMDRARLALEPARIVTEYGMTELSSQLWGAPGLPYRPPPWLRAVAVDPATGRKLPPGTVGQLRFYDLCNLDSSVAVDTFDEGSVDATGDVDLHGRLPGAPVRGCSLRAEDL